jgi:hypothetical protein
LVRKTPFDTKICGPFYQDRLGTSIGEALKNRDDAFFAGHTNATLDDCEAAMDKGAFFPDVFCPEPVLASFAVFRSE